MDIDRYVDALGTPEEWSNTLNVITTPEITEDVDTYEDRLTQKIIGSVSTKETVDQALNTLKQD